MYEGGIYEWAEEKNYKVNNFDAWADDNKQSCFVQAMVRMGRHDDLYKVEVRRNAYDFQSSAVTYLWCSGEGWREVYSAPYTSLACLETSYLKESYDLLEQDAIRALDTTNKIFSK